MPEAPTRFPIYVPTRGRPLVQRTVKNLARAGLTPILVVEDAEHDAYAAANPTCRVVVWPSSYMDDYERTPELDPHPTTGAAHNFAWDHSREEGFTHHWIMDDNINWFRYRATNGKTFFALTPQPFRWHEELMLRYRNLAGFALGLGHTFGSKPFSINTRLYCATLYRNDLNESGIRWRRGLNDDTIVSLDILKTGYWCTAESHMLVINKVPTSRTSRLPGGMTDFYADGGFIRKAAEAIRCHPDCVKMVNRYGRVHHQIDYSQFHQRLIPASQGPSQGSAQSPVRDTAPDYLKALPAVLINPDAYPDRLAQFTEHTAPLLASVTRTQAVDRSSLTDAEVTEWVQEWGRWRTEAVDAGVFPTFGGFQPMKPGPKAAAVMALWVGWQNALRQALDQGWERFLICEDDIRPRADLSQAPAPPPGGDINLWQGGLPMASFKAEDEAYRKGTPYRWKPVLSDNRPAVHSYLTTGAIEFTRRGAEEYLKALTEHPGHADHALGFAIRRVGLTQRIWPTPLVQYGTVIRNNTERTPTLKR